MLLRINIAQLASKMLGLSNSKHTPDACSPERYLERTKRCMERVLKLTLPGVSTSPKLNFEQCKHLADKLKLAVESALSFRFPASEETAVNLENFKLLYALSKEVESFIQDCCKDAWIQAALTLANMSEHISSISFNLELWTVVFSKSKISGARRSLTLNEVAGVFKAEDKIVKEKASLDMESLLRDLNAVLHSRNPTNREHQLAAFVVDRFYRSKLILASDLQRSSQAILSERVFGSVQQMEKLGKGSAATVYRGMWLGADVAMKTFYGPNNSDFNKEMSVLRGLSHSNVISLLYSTTDKRTCSIIMELMDIDLHSLMEARLKGCEEHESPFGILEAVEIMLQIGEGMCYLHELRIVHRDLKSLNILVRCGKVTKLESGYVLVKVSDFGLSKTKERSMTYSNQTPNLGTTRWMAPEMIKASKAESQAELLDGEAMIMNYPYKCDVYSFAMVCYEILTGDLPFQEISSIGDIKKLVLNGRRPQLPAGCHNNLKHLIERCWSQDASMRPCFGDVCAELRHLKSLLLIPCSIPTAMDAVMSKEASVDSSSHTSPKAASTAMAIADYSYVDYVEQSITSIDVVQTLSKDQQVQLNLRQCEYLAEKLTETGRYLRTKSNILFGICDDIPRKALLQLHFAVKRAEKLVRGCCCETESWLESAVTLARIKEDITDILLDLRWWTSMLDIAIASGTWMSSEQSIVLELVRSAQEDYKYLSDDLHLSDKSLQCAAYKDMDLLLRKLRDEEASYAGIDRTAEQNHDYLLSVHVRSCLENSALETMEDQLNEYDDCKMIGIGGFGAVMNVNWMGRRCALKILRMMCKEAAGLSQFQHPHIVKYFRHWEASPHATPRSENSVHDPRVAALQSHILMEVLPMDLAQHLQAWKSEQPPALPEDVVIDVMLQVVKAMWYLNDQDIAHRDLKPSNVLVRLVREDEVRELHYRGYLRAKLADFGLAKTKALSSAVSTLPSLRTKVYDAPEVFKKGIISDKKYPRKAAVWSFGVMFSEILSGKPPFPGVVDGTITLRDLHRRINDGLRPRLPESCPDYLKFIIASCCELRPEDRPDFSDLLRLVRLAQVQSLGLIPKDHDLFTYNCSRGYVRSLRRAPAPLVQSQAQERELKPRSMFWPIGWIIYNLVKCSNYKPSDAFLSSDCKPFGCLVNTVWPPDNTSRPLDSKVDVIFFEGNVGKRKDMSCKDTWVQRGKADVQWPRDWLPKDLGGDIRVLLLEYSISDYGVEGDLMDQLQRHLVFRSDHRWNRGQRPIVLVGHSLGCVVIEHLIIDLDRRARSIRTLEDETEIGRAKVAKAFLASLAGCFFYAPPWRGLVPSDNLLKHVFGALHYSRELFSDLRLDSPKLKLLSEDFMRARAEHMNLMAVTEGFHTRGRFVVPPVSVQDFAGAVIELDDSNHTGVCKPTDRRHQGYQKLLEFVRDILENSKAVQNQSKDKQAADSLNQEQ